MRIVLAAALTAAAAMTVHGQERPNFSGRWVQVDQPNAGEQRVKHDASTLSFQHGAEGTDHVVSYRLDGAESRNMLPSHGSQIVSIANAEWIGATVKITEATSYPDGRKMHSTQLWWLDAQGRLITELTTTFQGQRPQSTTVMHRKVD